MADFPAKVSTETSSPPSQGGVDRLRSMVSQYVSTDMDFLWTIPAILMLIEIGVRDYMPSGIWAFLFVVLGLVVWALIAASTYTNIPAYGWVMFVSVILWLLTILLFFMLLFRARERMEFLPWPLALLIFFGGATILYLTAFITNAASVGNNHQAASAFFAIVLTLVYGASTFFALLAWRQDGGNAASSTVPV